jgi:uncharacterized protein YuzE
MIATTYDPEADAMFIRFAGHEVKSVRTEEVSPGVMLDFAHDGRMIAIEILDVSDRMTARDKAA